MSRNQTVRNLAFAGLFAALIFLATWMFHIPIGLNGGYIHVGDSLIYLAATALPLPYAMAASAIGAGLSDLLSPGSIVYVLPTMLIKPILCLAFTAKGEQFLCRRNVVAIFVASVTGIVGYAIATSIITGSIAVAIAEIPLGILQPIGSGLCFLLWGFALDRVKLKQRIPRF